MNALLSREELSDFFEKDFGEPSDVPGAAKAQAKHIMLIIRNKMSYHNSFNAYYTIEFDDWQAIWNEVTKEEVE